MLLKDHTELAPRLEIYLNLDNLAGLPSTSIWHQRTGTLSEKLAGDGFTGVQLTNGEPPPPDSLPHCGLDRINQPSEADEIFARHKSRGDQCLTLHVGWGMESDQEMDLLVEAMLLAAQKHRLPAFLETHRATITQDMWRTVELTKRFPEVRFNADFSHYYCGQEMVYGDFAAKLGFLEPIFARTGFMHGRIAAPGFMQAPIESLDEAPRMAVGANYLQHFIEMWQRAMAGFLRASAPGDVLIFAPELLRADIYYARVFPDSSGHLVEECDRYEQALLYKTLAQRCFSAAAKSSPSS
jgi:hypothetical protein